MIDIKLIRENPDMVKDNISRRQDKAKLKMVDKVMKLDQSWVTNKKELDDLRKRKNELSEKIAKTKDKAKGKEPLIKESKALPQLISQKEKQVAELEKQIEQLMLQIPNLLHESVPYGKDDTENEVVREWGNIERKETAKSHVDILKELDIGETERAAKVAGARFYYLKNKLVLLDLALQRFALDYMIKKGFTILQTPLMVNRAVMQGAVDLSDFDDAIYKIEDEDLYLIGTSEHAIAGYHMNETLEAEKLPLKYAGLSACFRKEAGSHGKDTKGIFRVHQFNKIEQFVFALPEQSWKTQEELIKNAEHLFQQLELPYRIVNICTGDIGGTAAKKYDLEAWMPAQKTYREMVSCSNCTDYQARKLNIRYADKKNNRGVVHTLNSTAIATTRAMVAIIENHQEDGIIKIPKALQKYTGFDIIE
jgi:seryl-tRNA synthetase